MNRWDNYLGYDNELYHWGILGQKWGRRRWQNEDGSLTEAGRAHYGYGNAKESNRHQEKMADNEYKSTKAAERMNRDNAKRDIRLKQLDVDKVRASDELNRQKDKSSLEKAKLDYADKRAIEKAKLDQMKEKRKLEALKLKNKDRAEMMALKNEYKIAKMQEKTNREDMRRDYAEARRQQDYDFTYDWGTASAQQRYARNEQRVQKMLNKPGGIGSSVIKTGLTSAAAVAGTVGGAALTYALFKKYMNSHP